MLQLASLPEVQTSSIQLVRDLFGELTTRRVSYVHWKSNLALREALEGEGDLDLVVDTSSAATFQATLFELGFKLANQRTRDQQFSVYHYFGLDQESGKVIHLHVYYQMVTCGLLLKNYHLPFERLLLMNTSMSYGVRTPSKAAELVALVVRKMIEAGSFVELLLLLRDWEQVKDEFHWLLSDEHFTSNEIIEQACEIVDKWLPTLDRSLFKQAINAMQGDASPIWHFRLGKRFRAALRQFAVRSPISAATQSGFRLLARIVDKLTRRPIGRTLNTGGRVVAIVGPDASGKSTISSDLRKSLKGAFQVRSVHLGKPPTTLPTFVPGCLLPLARVMFPMSRSTVSREPRAESNGRSGTSALLFSLRAVIIAHDRHSAAIRVKRLATTGAIVVCDRFPTKTIGATDSPRLDPHDDECKRSRVLSWLARKEAAYYAAIPEPDLVISLQVPCDVAVLRNSDRIKDGKEDEAFIRDRHSQWDPTHYKSAETLQIDTSNELAATLLDVRREVWRRI